VADLEAAASRVRAALEDVFGAVAEIGAAFAAQRSGCLAAGAALTPDRLSGLREVIWRQLGLLPGADGAGVVAAPGVVAGKQRHLEWWQRTMAADGGQDGFARIRLNLDPESVDLYDYLDMDWFTGPRELGRRYVYGPLIDFSGADRYVLTLTIPVFAGGEAGVPGGEAGVPGREAGVPGDKRQAAGEREFLGIAGTDIRMGHLEPKLLAMLRTVPVPAVLVTGERRVLVANTPRWIPGTRLGRLPAPGDGTFAAVTEIGADSGWLLAAAALAAESPGVQPGGVLAHDLAPQPRGHRGRQRLGRRVEVPVRVVGGEHHPVRHPRELDRLRQVPGVVRLLDRLGAQPEVLAEVLRG
jgi:hypothetical protein